MEKKIRFVSFEPGAILNDPDFIALTYDDKGTYLLLVTYLYQNEGVLPFNFAYLRKICGRRIENTWQRIAHMFRISRGNLQIGRVSEDIKRAKNLSQVQREKGIIGMESRWHNDNTAITKRSEEKRSEDKRSEEKSEAQHFATPSSSSNGSSLPHAPASASLPQLVAQATAGGSRSPTAGTTPRDLTMKIMYFHDELCKIFPKRTPSDSSSIRNLAGWVQNRIKLGLFQDKIIGNVLAIARDSKKGKSRKPIAVFYAQLKTDLGYKQDG